MAIAAAHGAAAAGAGASEREAVAAPDPAARAAAERLIGAGIGDDHAYLRLSQLCDGIGNRLSGSEALTRAVTWAAAAMREDGLDAVRLQPVMVPRWVRGDEHAEMVMPGPQPLAMLGLGRSDGTPPGGITADVVVVTSFGQLDSLPDAAVRGHIVLYDVPFTRYGDTVRYRWGGAEHAARRGAVAALVRSVGPVSLRTPHTGAMAAYGDTLPHVPAAAVSIEDAAMMHRLLDRGERVRVHLEMGAHTEPDVPSDNVIGELRGRERPDEIVVVGGHLDSWDVGQGAQDDGAGCVLAMETLRLMKRLGLRPRRTVRCVLWVNEENGGRGGRAYADSLRGDVSRHVAAIESDGGAERPIGFQLGVHHPGSDSTDASRMTVGLERLRAIAPLFAGLGADHMTDGGGEADIGPLMDLGVAGISHRTTGEHYFDWHHTRADMLDKVDPVELRRNVAALAALVYLVADMPEPLAGPSPARHAAKALGTH
ncbi:MAG: M20/M25/M40 family metallo-hydrolase [Candidatus Eisenbacteria bacterium]